MDNEESIIIIGSLACFDQTTESLGAGTGLWSLRAGGGGLSLTFFPEPEGEPKWIPSSLACFPARIS